VPSAHSARNTNIAPLLVLFSYFNQNGRHIFIILCRRVYVMNHDHWLYFVHFIQKKNSNFLTAHSKVFTNSPFLR
jgi:hypothetical protein